MSVSLGLGAGRMKFGRVLSLVPTVCTGSFRKLGARNVTALSTSVGNAVMNSDVMPRFGMTVAIGSTVFHCPSLPTNMSRVGVGTRVGGPKKTVSLAAIDVHPFDFQLTKGPFDIATRVGAPVDSPSFRTRTGKMLGLNVVGRMCPLRSVRLGNAVGTSVRLTKGVSCVRGRRCRHMRTSKAVNLASVGLGVGSVPSVSVRGSLFAFAPGCLRLDRAAIGVNGGSLATSDHFRGCLNCTLGKAALGKALGVHSGRLGLGSFVATATSAAARITAAPTSDVDNVVRIPHGVSFRVSTGLGRMLFSGVTFAGVGKGLIIGSKGISVGGLSVGAVNNGIIVGNCCSATSIGGPRVGTKFGLGNLDFTRACGRLSVMRRLTPVFRGLGNGFSNDVGVRAVLSTTVDPILRAVRNGKDLSAGSLDLDKMGIVSRVTRTIGGPSLGRVGMGSVALSFAVGSKQITARPFSVGLNSCMVGLSKDAKLSRAVSCSNGVGLPTSTNSLTGLAALSLGVNKSFASPGISVSAGDVTGRTMRTMTSGTVDRLKGGLKLSSTTAGGGRSLGRTMGRGTTRGTLSFLGGGLG